MLPLQAAPGGWPKMAPYAVGGAEEIVGALVGAPRIVKLLPIVVGVDGGVLAHVWNMCPGWSGRLFRWPVGGSAVAEAG